VDRFDYSSIAPGFDTAGLHTVIQRVSALPPDQELPQQLDAELAHLARSPTSAAWSHIHLLAYRVMVMWTQWDSFFESGWKTSQESNGSEYFVRPYRITLAILAAALSRGEQLFIVECLWLYVIVRICFFAYNAILETRYLMPMLPSIELVVTTGIVLTALPL